MTVKQFYNYCKELGIENYEIQIEYYCDDDYYDCSSGITEKNIDAHDNKIIIYVEDD